MNENDADDDDNDDNDHAKRTNHTNGIYNTYLFSIVGLGVSGFLVISVYGEIACARNGDKTYRNLTRT